MGVRRRVLPVLAAVFLGGSLLVAVGTVSAGASPTWKVQASVPPTPNNLQSISCPTANRCVAVGGGSIVTSSDGGQHWANHTAPPLAPGKYLNLTSVSCPSISHCVAVSEAANQPMILVTSNGGTTWTAQPVSTSPGSSSVSCGTVSNCVAVSSGKVLTTADGGAHWATQTLPSGVIIDQVTCVTATRCVASGGQVILSTSDGGVTWTTQPTPSGGTVSGAISCPSVTNCFAFYGSLNFIGVLATTDGGATWVSQAAPAGVFSLSGISCPTISVCTAIGVGIVGYVSVYPVLGSTAITTTDGGSTWASRSVPNSTEEQRLYGVSCPTINTCVAVGATQPFFSEPPAVIVATADGGTTWVNQTSPTGISSGTPTSLGEVGLTGISCPSITNCVAVGSGQGTSGIFVTNNGGKRWSSEPLPVTVTTLLTGVSCPSTTHCVAVGGGVTITSDDGGSTWSQASGGGALTGVSCASVTQCVAVGESTIETSGDGGSTWVNQHVPLPPNTLGIDFLGVSCPSTTNCVAVGYGGIYTTTDGGVTWAYSTGIDDSAVSCPSVSTCVVGGEEAGQNVLLTTTDGGATWVSGTVTQAPSGTPGFPLAPPIPPPSGISCSSTTSCVAVEGGAAFGEGGGIIATTDGGATWTSQTVPHGVEDLNGVSCPSPSSCTAVGASGQFGGVIIRIG